MLYYKARIESDTGDFIDITKGINESDPRKAYTLFRALCLKIACATFPECSEPFIYMDSHILSLAHGQALDAHHAHHRCY